MYQFESFAMSTYNWTENYVLLGFVCLLTTWALVSISSIQRGLGLLLTSAKPTMYMLGGFDPFQRAKSKIQPLHCSPINTFSHLIVSAMSALKKCMVFAALNIMTNRVLKVRGHTLPFDRQAHFGTWGKVAFSDRHNLPLVHLCMKSSGNLVSTAVHASPDVKFLIWAFIILVSLHPVQANDDADLNRQVFICGLE